MQENILIITVIILIGVLISEIIAIYHLYKIKLLLKKETDVKESYFDLKLRLHSLQLTVVFATFLIFFLGWNIKEQIIGTITSDISSQIEPEVKELKSQADSIKLNYNTLSKNLSQKIVEIEQLSINYSKLQNNFLDLNQTMDSKIEFLGTLLNIYIVPNLKIDDDATKTTKYFFKDLKPVNAERLPSFGKPPIINIQTNWGLGLRVDEITKDYVVVAPIKGILVDNTFEFGKLTLWIIPNN